MFHAIQSIENQPFTWLTENVAENLDIELYLSHSGDKTISPFVERLKTINPETWLDNIANMIINKFTDKWNKIYNAFIQSNYNPLENYDMTQVETPNIRHDSIEKTSTKMKTTTSSGSTGKTYGFNSVNPVPVNEADADNETEVTGDGNENKVERGESETGTRQLTRHGNIGVTTSQQMLQSELDIRKFNFVDMLMNDVANVMCLSIYN